MKKQSTYINQLFSLKDKVVVITGGYGLLGKQFAKAVSSAGAQVVVSGRNIDKAMQIAKDVGGFAVEIDVTQKQSIENAVEQIMCKFGKIDGLINNASFSSPVNEKNNYSYSFESFSQKYWDKSIDVDLTGVFLCSQSIGRVMVKNNKGVIINISSIYGNVSPDQSIYRSIKDKNDNTFVKPISYCAVKSAVINITRYLSVYWAENNIRVNTLSLGGVKDNQNNVFVDAYSNKTPMGRMAKEGEYNGAIIFLLSDASSYMTGANLIIDGGWTAW